MHQSQSSVLERLKDGELGEVEYQLWMKGEKGDKSTWAYDLVFYFSLLVFLFPFKFSPTLFFFKFVIYEVVNCHHIEYALSIFDGCTFA